VFFFVATKAASFFFPQYCLDHFPDFSLEGEFVRGRRLVTVAISPHGRRRGGGDRSSTRRVFFLYIATVARWSQLADVVVSVLPKELSFLADSFTKKKKETPTCIHMSHVHAREGYKAKTLATKLTDAVDCIGGVS